MPKPTSQPAPAQDAPAAPAPTPDLVIDGVTYVNTHPEHPLYKAPAPAPEESTTQQPA